MLVVSGFLQETKSLTVQFRKQHWIDEEIMNDCHGLELFVGCNNQCLLEKLPVFGEN